MIWDEKRIAQSLGKVFGTTTKVCHFVGNNLIREKVNAGFESYLTRLNARSTQHSSSAIEWYLAARPCIKTGG